MLSDNSRRRLIIITCCSTFIVIIGYVIYLDVTNLVGLILGVMILNSLFNLKNGLINGKATTTRRFSSGQLEFKRDEKPLRYTASLFTDFLMIIFFSLVLYSIYVEDILNLPAP